MLDKLKVKEELLKKYRYIIDSSLNDLELYERLVSDLINYNEKDIKKLLDKIEVLKIEIDTLKEIEVMRLNKIDRLRNESKKLIITIKEDKNVRDIWSAKGYCYKLYICLKEVTQGNELIQDILNYELSFSERVSVRNLHLLNLIHDYNVKEIHTNVNIDKFIKENKLNDITVINN